MMHRLRSLGLDPDLDDPLNYRCPTCNADPGVLCTVAGPAGTPNRPTATPEPNRPDRTL